MENITNDETIKECSKLLGHQVENKPDLDTSKIILTSETNPKLLRICNIARGTARTTTGTATIYTTPSDKDFYLYSATLDLFQDATHDGATGAQALIQLSLDGSTQSILLLSAATLTAASKSISISFPRPLKIDRGTAIQLAGSTYSAGVKVRCASIVGYTVDQTQSI